MMLFIMFTLYLLELTNRLAVIVIYKMAEFASWIHHGYIGTGVSLAITGSVLAYHFMEEIHSSMELAEKNKGGTLSSWSAVILCYAFLLGLVGECMSFTSHPIIHFILTMICLVFIRIASVLSKLYEVQKEELNLGNVEVRKVIYSTVIQGVFYAALLLM